MLPASPANKVIFASFAATCEGLKAGSYLGLHPDNQFEPAKFLQKLTIGRPTSAAKLFQIDLLSVLANRGQDGKRHSQRTAPVFEANQRPGAMLQAFDK